MTYKYDHANGQIIDDEDGQVIATMSDSATREQGVALVDAYNKLQAQSTDSVDTQSAPAP